MKTKNLLITLAAVLTFAGTLQAQQGLQLEVSQKNPETTANNLLNDAYAAVNDMNRIDDLSYLLEEKEANADTVIVNINDRKKVVVVERDEEGRTKEIIYYKRNSRSKVARMNILFEMGINTYNDRNYFSGSKDHTGIPYPDLHTSKSVNVAIYPVFGTFRITKNGLLNFQTGLGFDWGNYRFEDGWTITKENGITVPSDKYRPNGENLLSKSKLVTVHLNVPLMLNLKFPNKFYLSAGIIGGLKIGSHTKIKYDHGGKKEKDRSSFNLNPVRYDLTFRAGYRWVGAYFNYQMTPMFESNKGPKLFPYSIGLTFKL